MSRCLLAAAVAAIVTAPVPTLAAPGPGVGNRPCATGEMFAPIVVFGHANGTPDDSPGKDYGHNVVIMADGYLMLLFAPDSGGPSGGLLFYDIADPRHPRLVKTIRNADTERFRETHSLPVARVGDRYLVAVQTVVGIQIWDITDAMTAHKVGELTLEGVDAGDYTNVAWQLSWQFPYLFVAGAGHGFHVVDTRDPAAPRLVTRVPTSQSGGFRIGPIFALGDYLVVANMDQDGRYALLDIADAAHPALLDTLTGLPKIYSASVVGDRIYGAGRDGDLLIHRFGPDGLHEVHRAAIPGDGLYLSYQDGYLHYGLTASYMKVDVRDEQHPTVVGEGVLGGEHKDHGQTTPLGNLVFIGNDHGTGSALFCHQPDPDETPPSVVKVFPPDGTLHQPRTSRIAISFSDNIDIHTVSPETVVVRAVGGDVVAGGYSYVFNTVSFGPREPLAPDTSYQIVLRAGGVADAAGNRLTEEQVTRFSTGDAIEEPPPDAGPDAPEPPPPDDAAVPGDGGPGFDDHEIAASCNCHTAGGGEPAALALVTALVVGRRRPRR